jgi:serine/threonine-protein kinase RIO1|tara:strand:+ start:37 stop:249 length:213 start_codon:yes stop_codon:yes gene_type:complete
VEINVISEEEVGDIVLSMVSEEMNPDHYCEDGSIRMDIKNLQDYYHQTVVSQINKLWKRVEELEKEVEKL